MDVIESIVPKPIIYLIVALATLTCLKFVVGLTLHDFISGILAEISSLVSNVNSTAGLNALLVVLMFILILIFFGASYIIREIYEIERLFWQGVAGEEQEKILALFSLALLGGAELLSVVAARR
jgi:hypothetical protein